MHYAGLFPLRESGAATYLLIIALSVTSLLRMAIEPLMFGMVGVGIGAFVPFRSIAITASVAWVAFYFLLMIMVQQLNLEYLIAALDAVSAAATELTLAAAHQRLALTLAQTVFIELALPLALPYLLIRLVIRLVARQMQAN